MRKITCFLAFIILNTSLFADDPKPEWSIADNGGTQVKIETEHLIFISVNYKRDLENFIALYTNQNNIGKYYLDGKPWKIKKAKSVLSNWSNRWKKRIPYSAFAVYLKKEYTEKKKADEFIGAMPFGFSGRAGFAELAGIGLEDFQNKGYGTEASPVLRVYTSELRKEAIPLGEDQLVGVHATASKQHPATGKMLIKNGFKKCDGENYYDTDKQHYELVFTETKAGRTNRTKRPSHE